MPRDQLFINSNATLTHMSLVMHFITRTSHWCASGYETGLLPGKMILNVTNEIPDIRSIIEA